MADRLILAPTYHEHLDAPLIFLAGPITGAPDWQAAAYDIIHTRSPDLYVANPRRPIDVGSKDFSKDMYAEQVDWESHHLAIAGKTGVILFWYALEVNHNCRRPYSQTTRQEFGEWVNEHKHAGTKIVVGIEPEHPAQKYITYRLPKECPEIPIFSELEATCVEAIRLCI
ncbi:MAG: nucleoside 2-deoxyribosyltransferase domain-containing protein [Nanoarchaeota archaeon]